MAFLTIILNEKEARDARTRISEIDSILKSSSTFTSLIRGIPPNILANFRKSVESHKDELNSMLLAYEDAKRGNSSDLLKRVGNKPGLALIVARIARNMSQKDLALKAGLKEQQIQRYEADRYRSISLHNYQKMANILGLEWNLRASEWQKSGWALTSNIDAQKIKKVLRYAKDSGWLPQDDNERDSLDYLSRYISEHIIKYGTPSLLRTGMNAKKIDDDIALLAWKSRVVKLAEQDLVNLKGEYNPIDLNWVPELVKLTLADDGPLQAKALLSEKGIVLIIQHSIPGMEVDGAAFLIDNVPVIGMTLRRDALDNFWFTLLHEVGHIILHSRTGLAAGFFDNVENKEIDQFEDEANNFASNMLIHDEKWKRSPVRASKSPQAIEQFARDLLVHPAIVFGRLRRERDNYTIFSDHIGRGTVRRMFF